MGRKRSRLELLGPPCWDEDTALGRSRRKSWQTNSSRGADRLPSGARLTEQSAKRNMCPTRRMASPTPWSPASHCALAHIGPSGLGACSIYSARLARAERCALGTATHLDIRRGFSADRVRRSDSSPGDVRSAPRSSANVAAVVAATLWVRLLLRCAVPRARPEA